jgi:hypothetical protein
LKKVVDIHLVRWYSNKAVAENGTASSLITEQQCNPENIPNLKEISEALR